MVSCRSAPTADCQVWQGRLMVLEGVPAKELTKLHGELIAYDWVGQNNGTVIPGQPGVVAGCYRVTLDGLGALKRFHAGTDADTEDEIEEAKRPPASEEKKPRRKREPKPAKAPELTTEQPT